MKKRAVFCIQCIWKHNILFTYNVISFDDWFLKLSDVDLTEGHISVEFNPIALGKTP